MEIEAPAILYCLEKIVVSIAIAFAVVAVVVVVVVVVLVVVAVVAVPVAPLAEKASLLLRSNSK